MNLRDLQYLVAVANLRHFGKAAKACFVSQPALSMQIQKLEESLGVTLVERSNKRVMLTTIGEEIVERAKHILDEVESIKSIAHASQNPHAGKFTLGAFPTLAPYLFPNIVPKIVKSFPMLKLFLLEEKTDELLQKLKQGELDAALIALPIHDDQLEYLSLFEDPFLLALPKSHALAKRKQIKAADIKNEHLLLLEEGHCLRNQALSICAGIGSEEQHNFRATSLETLRQMVAMGVGITLIPRLAKKLHDGIAYVPFSNPVPSRTIALVWRKTSPRQALCLKMGEIVKRAVD